MTKVTVVDEVPSFQLFSQGADVPQYNVCDDVTFSLGRQGTGLTRRLSGLQSPVVNIESTSNLQCICTGSWLWALPPPCDLLCILVLPSSVRARVER